MVSGVGRRMGVLDRCGDRRRERQLWGKCGHLIVTDGILCVSGGDAALPRLLWDFLLPTSAVADGWVADQWHQCLALCPRSRGPSDGQRQHVGIQEFW